MDPPGFLNTLLQLYTVYEEVFGFIELTFVEIAKTAADIVKRLTEANDNDITIIGDTVERRQTCYVGVSRFIYRCCLGFMCWECHHTCFV